MKLAIYGAGSMGTVLGAYLAKNGVEIDLFNHNEPHVTALKKNGAHIVGKVDFVQPVHAFLPREMTGKYDVVFLMTKQLDNANVVRGLVPFLAADGVVCTMQNGVPEPSVADVIGPARTFGCAVGWGATLKSPGVAELTSEPMYDALAFSLGSMTGRQDAVLAEIARILGLMGKVTVEADFMGARWSKLLVNAAFSGLSACLGCTFGEVAANRRSRLAAQRIIKECIDVAKRAGITLVPIQGKDIAKLFDFHGWLKQKFGFMLIPIAMKKHRLIRSSMLLDFAKGRKSEINAINGVVCAQGDKLGFDTPYDDLVVAIVTDIESGTTKPCWENLDRFDHLK